jgi:hypothetical protein
MTEKLAARRNSPRRPFTRRRLIKSPDRIERRNVEFLVVLMCGTKVPCCRIDARLALLEIHNSFSELSDRAFGRA